MKKICLILLVAIMMCGAGGWYLIARLSASELQLCAVGSGGITLPRMACEHYLTQWQDWQSSAWQQDFNANGGISFILTDLEDGHYAQHLQLAERLLQKGADINFINPLSGYSALHEAVLVNNSAAVEFLVQHQADQTVLDKNFNKTPLALALFLQQQNPSIDRSAVLGLLGP